jgi:uncharacterized protein (DUF2141 family)
MSLLLLIAAQAALPSTPDLGTAAGRCRPAESGPSFLVTVEGLKDRRGLLKIEVYPDNDQDFLADDNKLIAAGKVFTRVEEPTPSSRRVQLCIRVPHAGRYALSVLHDRDGNHKFGMSSDGIGFAGNPKLGWSKPHADAASATAHDRPTPITVVMNYRHGLLSFGPIQGAH